MSKSVRVARGLCLALIFAAVVTVVAGCTAGPAKAPIKPVTKPAASPVGDYKSGNPIVLASGGKVTVPKGWSAHLNAAGALVTNPPAESGTLGGSMETTGKPVSTMALFVYGPKAGFKDQLKHWTDVYKATNISGEPRFAITMSKSVLDSGVQVTSFVTTYAGTKRREIEMALQHQGDLPVVIAVDTVPSSFATATDAELPRQLIEFFGYAVR